MSPPATASTRQTCQRCGKAFYAGGVWGVVRSSRFCSTFCSARPLEELDHALERAMTFLLRQRGRRGVVSLTEVAAHVGVDRASQLPRALEAVRRLEQSGVVERARHAEVDADDFFIRLAQRREHEEITQPGSGIRARVRRASWRDA